MVFAGLRDDRCVDVVAYLEATEKAAEEATRGDGQQPPQPRCSPAVRRGSGVSGLRSRKQRQKQPSNLLQSAVAKL